MAYHLGPRGRQLVELLLRLLLRAERRPWDVEETVAVVLVTVILSSEASFDPGCSKVSQFMLDNGEVLMIVTVGFLCGETSIE